MRGGGAAYAGVIDSVAMACPAGMPPDSLVVGPSTHIQHVCRCVSTLTMASIRPIIQTITRVCLRVYVCMCTVVLSVLQSAILGYGLFQGLGAAGLLSRHLNAAENVIVQTTAGKGRSCRPVKQLYNCPAIAGRACWCCQTCVGSDAALQQSMRGFSAPREGSNLGRD